MMLFRKLVGRALLWFIEPARAERAEEFVRRSRDGLVYRPARYGKPKGW